MDDLEYYKLFKKHKSITRSNWGGYALDIRLWEEESPIVKLRYMNNTVLDGLESVGICSDRLIGLGSSFLTKTPESGLFILGKCILRNMVILVKLK